MERPNTEGERANKMAFSASFVPAKTQTAPTTITRFPDNPETLFLKQCKTIKDLKQIHAHLIKTRLIHNRRMAENLVESAAILIPGISMDYPISIFQKLKEPNSAAYNLMIRGFTLKKLPSEAMLLFHEMCERSVRPDEFTFPCILKACSRLHALKEGQQIHALVMKYGLGFDGFVLNALIGFYAGCGEVDVARHVFDGLNDRSVSAWNWMFAGYYKIRRWEEVVGFFRKMLDMEVGFDKITLTCVLAACGRLNDLELGEWIHEYVEANGLKGDSSLVTSLVDMYAKCGCVDTARRLFNEMPRRDVVAWNAIISGYIQTSRHKEALELFHEMQKSDTEPNELTMVSFLSSCAILGALDTGKRLHSYAMKKKMQLTVNLGTALMDLYLKCGSVANAIEVFGEMPSKDVVSWTVLIKGLASNGQGKKGIEFFNSMVEKNIVPDNVTFVAVLCACSQAGLVDQGRRFFVSMSRDFGIEPEIEHYGCMVEMLGRAGFVEEAYQFINNMPIQPNVVIWGKLLASCKVHKNVEFGEESIKNVVRLEPMRSGDYILLSNIFASLGRLEDAFRVRNQMKEKGIKETPGCSAIELDGIIHEFFTEDNIHPDSEEVYNATENMMNIIKPAGYVPNTTWVRLDAGEDDKESSISRHSEKLAIAFGLIRTSPGTVIRVTKNLRMCMDCHIATKMVSEVFDREIVVRDRSFFHHFKAGSCSCNDYW